MFNSVIHELNGWLDRDDWPRINRIHEYLKATTYHPSHAEALEYLETVIGFQKMGIKYRRDPLNLNFLKET
jgi:hypothetical protein